MKTDPGEKVEGFVCLIDVQHHIPDDTHGVRVYFDLDDLKKKHPMYAECGVAKVNIEFVEIVVNQDLMNRTKTAKRLAERDTSHDDDNEEEEPPNSRGY